MPKPLVLLLAAFWIYLAYGAFSRGDTPKALIFLGVGSAITVWRLGLVGGARK
jgi:hypothetical protein